MNRKNAAARLWQYIGECARLLYWIYFKPYTLDRWLQEIHPELNRNSNPFAMQAEFPGNRRLRHYAGQVWSLSTALPPLAMLLVVIYSPWLHGALFLLGWFAGLLLARLNIEKLEKQSKPAIWTVFGMLLVLVIISCFYFEFTDLFCYNYLSCFLHITTGIMAGILAGGIAGFSVGGLLGNIAFFLNTKEENDRNINDKDVIEIIKFTNILKSILGSSVAANLLLCVIAFMFFLIITGFILTTSRDISYSAYQHNLEYYKNTGNIFLYYQSIVLSLLNQLFSSLTWSAVLTLLPLSWLGIFLTLLKCVCLIAELVWTIALFQLSRFISASSLLRYLPTYFDELIDLPLPFMDRLIAKAHLENRDAASETIGYLISSTNQQRAAARAMGLISIDSLSHCQTLGDIAATADRMNWVSLLPPAEFSPVLLQFLEISQSVRSAATGTSAYRKIELLNSPIAALSDLRDSLAFSKNTDLAARLASIGQRWQATLEAARRTLEEESRYSREISQVYISGPSLDPETAKNRFKGRQDIFREIETVALSPQPPVLLLYGGRRSGKTSALKYLPEKVGGELVPLLVDVQGGATATTLRSLARYLAEQIIEAAWRSRNLQLPYPDKQELAEDPFPALQRWLQEVERIAPGKRFLLCLDEFERLSEVVRETGSRSPLNFLRHVMQHRQQWILLFSGSHTLDELDDYWSDYLINTQSLRLTYLREEEARELIVAPVKDFPDIYQPEAVARIVELTRCQPFLVQLLCSALVEELNRKAAGADPRATKATAADVEAIVPKALETGGMYFRELWRLTLGDQERQAIARLLRGEPATPEDSSAWRKLEQKEVLEIAATGEAHPTEARTFQVPLVQRYIEKAIEEM